MPTHAEKRSMPYSAKQMYDLVGDVASYPEFLPWCSAARIRQTTQVEHRIIMDADLVIAFKVFRERFGSRVTLNPDDTSILVEYLDGPFKYLKNTWHFEQTLTGCDVDFYVDFEFKSKVLQTLIGVVFGEAMRRIVGGFEQRAIALYGKA
jgi:coenzyme Q-binding protein COQ10